MGVNSPKTDGWSAEDGILKCKGAVDDLITVRKYWNFELHAEFKLAARSNSGIGLRGRYEVQIASDYGRPPGMHGTGALYTRILPRVNAGKAPDEWQTYDIRLVGREVTATLNGENALREGRDRWSDWHRDRPVRGQAGLDRTARRSRFGRIPEPGPHPVDQTEISRGSAGIQRNGTRPQRGLASSSRCLLKRTSRFAVGPRTAPKSRSFS